MGRFSIQEIFLSSTPNLIRNLQNSHGFTMFNEASSMSDVLEMRDVDFLSKQPADDFRPFVI